MYDIMTHKRLATFHHIPFLDTQRKPISNSPSKLAGAGWERTPASYNTDEVVCRTCWACFRDWDGESPVAVHRIINPNCPFLNDLPIGATTSDGRPLIASQVKRQLLLALPPESRTGEATADDSTAPLSTSLLQMIVGHPFMPFGGFAMHFAGIRLVTYAVQNLPVSTYIDWAEKGFILKQESELQCVYCGVAADCDGNHQPDQVHQEKAPHCPLFNGIDVGNIAIDEENRIRQKYLAQIGQADNVMAGLELSPAVKFYEYEDNGKRIESFKKQGWPSLLADKFSPARMSSAGFFYTGSSDKVRCFSCGIGIFDWMSDAEPLTQHARWSPSCQFLKDTLAAEAVTRASNAEELTKAVYPGQKTGESNVILTMEGVSRDVMDFEAIDAGLNANYSFQQISRVVLGFLQRTKRYPTTEALMAALKVDHELTSVIMKKDNALQEKAEAVANVLQEKDNALQEKDEAVANVLQEKEKLARQNMRHRLFISDLVQRLIISPADDDAARLRAGRAGNSQQMSHENPQIPDALQCKLCYSAKLDVIFWPCKHILCCDKCVTKLGDHCPCCRARFTEAKRIYIV